MDSLFEGADPAWLLKTARNGLRAYMTTRCAVSSQHKLPGREELLTTVTGSFLGREMNEKALNELIAEGKVIVYGNCYYSDHEIDVL